MDKRPSLLAVGITLIFLGIVGVPPPALGDPCLMVYPDSPCAYHYDPAEHYTVGPGNPLYHPAYDRGGEVLIEVNTNDVAYEVYQAPSLVGFVMDAENQGYFTIGTNLDVIVDGFCNEPTTYANVLVVFDRIEPEWCEPSILVEGSEVFYDGGLGWYYPIGDLVVSTPTPWGNNYSDTVTLDVVWQNCYGVRIYAFSDENYNLVRDGVECFSAYSHDTTVPAGRSTWGAIKALYSE